MGLLYVFSACPFVIVPYSIIDIFASSRRSVLKGRRVSATLTEAQYLPRKRAMCMSLLKSKIHLIATWGVAVK